MLILLLKSRKTNSPADTIAIMRYAVFLKLSGRNPLTCISVMNHANLSNAPPKLAAPSAVFMGSIISSMSRAIWLPLTMSHAIPASTRAMHIGRGVGSAARYMSASAIKQPKNITASFLKACSCSRSFSAHQGTPAAFRQRFSEAEAPPFP